MTDIAGVFDSWESDRLAIRAKFFNDGRRHAFKNLADSQRQKALVPFLTASALMNGIVLCVGVDKQLQDSNLGYDFIEFPTLKPNILAKMTKIGLFGSILLSGLCKEGQSVHWITDDDEIVSNETNQQAAGQVFGWLIREHCIQNLDVQIGVAGKFDDNMRAEDLCSIPDLVGGAMSDLLNSIVEGSIPNFSLLHSPILKRQSTKTTLIGSWFADQDRPLKSLFCVVRPAESGKLRLSFGSPNITSTEDRFGQLWHPLDKGWKKSSEYW